jgi:hypothetical protein
MVLCFLDTLEEFRDLSLEEWNFRANLLIHIEILLEQQRLYWRRRDKIKWAKLGDENTIFFHPSATINHNKNSIMILTLQGRNTSPMKKMPLSSRKLSKKECEPVISLIYI